MTEALWAQVISGFFGLATIVISAYVPRRINRRRDEEAGDRDGLDDDRTRL